MELSLLGFFFMDLIIKPSSISKLINLHLLFSICDLRGYISFLFLWKVPTSVR